MLQSSCDPVLLMCPPDFYKVRKPDIENGAANKFEIEGYKEYIKDPKEFLRDAHRQHKKLKNLFGSIGAHVIEVEPKEGEHDAVFTADAFLSIVKNGWNITKNQSVSSHALTILSHFSNEERQGEVVIHADFFEKQTPGRTMIRSHYRMEGTGDNLYDPFRDLFWSGYVHNASRATASAGRSDIRAHAALASTTGVEVISLEVKSPFFHDDTSVGLLPRGHVVCFPDGLHPKSYQTLIEQAFHRFDLSPETHLIRVSEEDAKRLACNFRCVGDTVVMPLCSDDLIDRIRKAGYRPVNTDVGKFIAAGGAIHCLTNNINEQRKLADARQVENRSSLSLRSSGLQKT
jgi:N-dimethylarginine dimethylaminohydrolase